MTGRRLPLRATIAAGALLLLLAAPAGAHPFFQGGEVPVDSLATLTLDLAHGCASEEPGAGEDTTEVALEVPDWMRVVDVPEPDGWDVEVEHADDGVTVETVTWLTAHPTEPAPTFDLDVVVDGEPGEERYVGVFQACDDHVHRWVGTPDEPADEPAVRVRLVDADPDSPPPPAPEPEPEPDADADPEPAEVEDPADTANEGGAPDPADEPEDPVDDTVEEEAALAEAETPAADDGAPWGLILAGIVCLAAAGATVATWARRRGAGGNGSGPHGATAS